MQPVLVLLVQQPALARFVLVPLMPLLVAPATQLEVAAIPSDAKLKDVEMPKSDLVDFKFRDGKAVLTFENPGETEIWFTAGKDIKSEKKKFTVISKEEKAQREAAKLAEKQAQEEAEKQAEFCITWNS